MKLELPWPTLSHRIPNVLNRVLLWTAVIRAPARIGRFGCDLLHLKQLSLLVVLSAISLLAQGQVIDATKRDTVFYDADGNLLANPGDSIRYIMIITNTRSGPDSSLVVPINAPTNTTLNSGSVLTSPLAVDDGPYEVLGNMGIGVPAGSGVLVNDFDDNIAGLSISAPTLNTVVPTAQGGTINIQADGSFVYNAPPGFQGADSVAYTVTDGTPAPNCPTTNDAFIRFTVSNIIWFINENVSGGGNNGTLGDPFETLAAFESVNGNGGATDPAANQTIFVYSSATQYAGGVTLENGQQLLGQGMTSSIVAATGITLPMFSLALPVTGGSNPQIVDNAPGNAVTLASGNDLRGFDIGSNGTPANGSGIVGSNVGDLSISEGVSIFINDPNAGPGIDINGGGTIAVELVQLSLTGSSTEGIDLNNISGGSFEVTGTTSITNSANAAVDITSSASATFTFNTLNITNTAANTLGLFVNNGGTVNTTAGTINTGTNRAVDINNTALGIDLTSVSSSGGTLPGIDLNTTTGHFIVYGDGSNTTRGGNASGGTIANKTGANGGGDLCTFATGVGVGVLLNSADSVILRRMQLNGFSNWAIWGSTVDVFNFEYSTIDGVNGGSAADDEGCVAFCDLIGTSLFLLSDIQGGLEDNISIQNGTGTMLDSLIVENTRIGLNSNALGNDGILVEARNNAQINMRISNSDFIGARGDLVQTNALGTSVMGIVIKGNNFNNTHGNTLGGGITLSGGSNTSNITVNYLVDLNDFSGAVVSAITANFLSNQGTATGTISNNDIGTAAANSGSTGGSGISAGCEKNGAGGADITHTVTIHNNTIQQVNFAGIDVFASRGANAGSRAETYATVTSNNVSGMGGFGLSAAYFVVGGSAQCGDFALLCSNVSNNTFDNSAAPFGSNAVSYDQVSIDATHNLPAYAGSANGEFPPGMTMVCPACAGGAGTASVNISTYLVGKGNTMTNGPFPGIAGSFVDASLACGVTGSGMTCP